MVRSGEAEGAALEAERRVVIAELVEDMVVGYEVIGVGQRGRCSGAAASMDREGGGGGPCTHPEGVFTHSPPCGVGSVEAISDGAAGGVRDLVGLGAEVVGGSGCRNVAYDARLSWQEEDSLCCISLFDRSER